MANENLERTSFEKVKDDELEIIRKLREINNPNAEQLDADNAQNKANSAKTNKTENLVGIAFSGGGIRSATFGLGVLEALKEKDLLKKIDYISTVSGGGYIGAWLSANCHRHGNSWLEKSTKQEDWNESIKHLRRYSNYLSPNLSLFSADTWSMVTIWLRNTLLVQLMIIFTIACLLLGPRILFSIFNEYSGTPEWSYLTIILFIIGSIGISINLRGLSLPNHKGKSSEMFSQLAVQITLVLPFIIASLGCTGILWENVKRWDGQKKSYGDIFESIFLKPAIIFLYFYS